MEAQNFFSDYHIQKLENGKMVSAFDCGDDDLNDFLINDAPLYHNALLATTYILQNKTSGKTIAYFSVANDRISIDDFPNNTEFNRFRKNKFVNDKRMKSYPAIKICRLGIDKSMQGKQIGTFLIDFIETLFITNNKSGCRFLSVDAYQQAIPFYQKNDFEFLCSSDRQQRTRLMFFDLSDLLD
ncbi:MAG: GNAT family N-acetyltransferase [Bacteroides sp.]|nr:GNAT family N-acetyltransferase [Ruminococcus flavefaciens]MCM1555045.1 GNAT family N-acetyltransferase [Bacteroides sp.]MCM1555504.1 GNAT family N-acetyltransferase [Bacteroides sp.]